MMVKTKELRPRGMSKDVRLLAKYLLGNGYSKDEAISYMVNFMYDTGGNGKRWKKYIEDTISQLMGLDNPNRYYLRDVTEVRITQKELESIKNLNVEFQRRYAFGLVVYCKILNGHKQDKWIQMDSTGGFAKDCKVSANGKARELLFNGLLKNGLIKTSRMSGNTSIEITFVDYDYKDDDLVIPLKHLDKFINYYYHEMNKKEKRCYVCQECGEYVECAKGENVSKRCSNCSRFKKGYTKEKKE